MLLLDVTIYSLFQRYNLYDVVYFQIYALQIQALSDASFSESGYFRYSFQMQAIFSSRLFLDAKSLRFRLYQILALQLYALLDSGPLTDTLVQSQTPTYTSFRLRLFQNQDLWDDFWISYVYKSSDSKCLPHTNNSKIIHSRHLVFLKRYSITLFFMKTTSNWIHMQPNKPPRLNIRPNPRPTSGHTWRYHPRSNPVLEIPYNPRTGSRLEPAQYPIQDPE